MTDQSVSMTMPLVAASISAVGQISLKYAMLKHGTIEVTPRGIISLVLEPRLIFAMAIYSVALFLWLQVLSKTPLSTAYPILAVTYIIVPILSTFFFGEMLGRNQMIGMFLIMAGVTMIGKT